MVVVLVVCGMVILSATLMSILVIALPMPCAENWAFLLFQLLMVGIIDKHWSIDLLQDL